MFKYEDMRKMILLQEQHPDTPILLIFQNSKTKIRKGSPTSYGDWATKHNFKWIDAKQLTPDFFDNEEEVDPHIGCPSYPNCDIDPNGCLLISGANTEFYGHKD